MKHLNILIIDDSEIIRVRLVEKLKTLGCLINIFQADNYRNGLKQFISFLPELIIMDIQLPDGDGIELLDIIKTRAPNTHVIIMTNYPLLIFKKLCTDSGAEYFFDKSNDFEKLLFSIKQICSDRS